MKKERLENLLYNAIVYIYDIDGEDFDAEDELGITQEELEEIGIIEDVEEPEISWVSIGGGEND